MFEPPYTYKAKIIRVIDGDTMEVLVDLGMYVKMTITIRLFGIDTPEIRGEEREEGLKVKDYVKSLIEGKEVLIKTHKDSKGKYGRWLAEIIGDFGEGNSPNLTTHLLSLGMGQEYYC